jgi:hypothetical protein
MFKIYYAFFVFDFDIRQLMNVEYIESLEFIKFGPCEIKYFCTIMEPKPVL